MKLKLVVAMPALVILTACLVAPRRGGGLEVIPILPVLVELEVEQPYYVDGGYHYFYSNDRWLYATSRNGPWMELPRSHWPRETRWKKGHDRGRDRGRDRH